WDAVLAEPKYRYLMLDTRHFDQAFKTQLLATIDDLDEQFDGLLVHSENFQALNLLQERYKEQVKCIYRDPPYNTGGDGFIYRDGFSHSSWLALLSSLVDSSYGLLNERGVFTVSNDNNENHRLISLFNSVYGEENFIENLVWQKKVSPSNDSKDFSYDHEYLTVYSKNRSTLPISRLKRTDSQNKFYTNPDEDPLGAWNSVALTCNKSDVERPNLYYPIVNPNTGEEVWPKRTAVWRYPENKMKEYQSQGKLYWGKDGLSKSPRFKKYLDEAGDVVPRSIWMYQDVGSTQSSSIEILNLFNGSAFSTPKPSRLLERVVA